MSANVKAHLTAGIMRWRLVHALSSNTPDVLATRTDLALERSVKAPAFVNQKPTQMPPLKGRLPFVTRPRKPGHVLTLLPNGTTTRLMERAIDSTMVVVKGLEIGSTTSKAARRLALTIKVM
ncbi:hypothetical protein TELCIR_05292 [Teladorsagia circumcincta]|uniref:Uncharacterized protein n=1 Tax=Teladorsagia circumcincta TaxID=45464 RepID=A0A2G9UR78_TELCI|nr:hypothetical protein TELCIR_05292 [Teladorsagia circumcincta]